MTWLVFAVSGLLVLAGAAAVISGMPIIQLERGWAEVISGTVALAGGGITFALGVVLVRLEALQKSFGSAQTRDEGPDLDMPVAAHEPPPSDFRSSLHPPAHADAEAAIMPVEASEGTSETRHGLWKRVRRPAPYPAGLDENPLPPPDANAFDPPRAPPALGAPSETPARPPVPMERPLPDLQGSEPQLQPGGGAAPPSAEELETDGEETAMPLRGAALTETWLSQPILKLRPQRPVARPADPVQQPETLLARSDFADPPVGERPPASGISEPLDVSDEPLAIERLETAQPTVVGRYQAGVASYVMYSDGTIHVETDGGEVHRFESMDELKAFIARQDISVT